MIINDIRKELKEGVWTSPHLMYRRSMKWRANKYSPPLGSTQGDIVGLYIWEWDRICVTSDSMLWYTVGDGRWHSMYVCVCMLCYGVCVLLCYGVSATSEHGREKESEVCIGSRGLCYRVAQTTFMPLMHATLTLFTILSLASLLIFSLCFTRHYQPLLTALYFDSLYSYI